MKIISEPLIYKKKKSQSSTLHINKRKQYNNQDDRQPDSQGHATRLCMAGTVHSNQNKTQNRSSCILDTATLISTATELYRKIT